MPQQLKVFIYLIIPPILWAGNTVVGKAAGEFIGPFSLSFFRWLIASSLILLIAAKPLYDARALLRKHYLVLLVLGITGTTLFNSFLYLGLTKTSANNAAIVLAMMPAAIISLNFLLKEERATVKQMLGLLVSLLGVLWVISKGELRRLLELEFNHGDLIVLCGVVSWALYSVVLKKWRPPELGILPLLAAQILIGTVFVFPLYLFEVTNHAPVHWQKETFMMLAYVAVFPSLVAYYFWQQGIAMGGANIAGLISPSITLFTAFFAYLFLHETLSTQQLIGAFIIIAGVSIAILGSAQKRYNGQNTSAQQRKPESK
jgi:drug/metabolite transporter (DMT)-like permease